ncbi:MAG: hypothetical protein O6922_04580 [Chloroflexi bacterium]|nr:hypothetical protein [Chloroflexota bacterium]
MAQTQRFSVTALDRQENLIRDPGLSYRFQVVGNIGRIHVDGNFTAGTVAGSGAVEAIYGGISGRAEVKIAPGPLHDVFLNSMDSSVMIGQVQRFDMIALDRYDNPIPDLAHEFVVDERIGRIDSNGFFTAGTEAGRYPGAISVRVAQGTNSLSATADVVIRGPISEVIARSTPPRTILVVDSDAGDYIGGGKFWVIDEDDVEFTISYSPHTSMNAIHVVVDYGDWVLRFEAPRDSRLEAGDYLIATGHTSLDVAEAGLAVMHKNRACDTSSGSLKILEVSYGESGSEILSFAAYFEQGCENRGPGLRGQIHVNSVADPAG